MNYWEIWASIADGVIANISQFTPSSYAEANYYAKELYGANAFAVNVTQYPVMIGDKYVNGRFIRTFIDEEGVEHTEEILPFPTIEQQTDRNTFNIASHDEAIDDIWVTILEG